MFGCSLGSDRGGVGVSMWFITVGCNRGFDSGKIGRYHLNYCDFCRNIALGSNLGTERGRVDSYVLIGVSMW